MFQQFITKQNESTCSLIWLTTIHNENSDFMSFKNN